MEFRADVKRALWFVPFLILLFLMGQVQALTDPLWIDGTVTSPVGEAVYDANDFWTFNFTVTNTNRTDLVGYVEIQVVLLKSLIAVSPVEGGFYNFSGNIVDFMVDEIPLGSFLVSKINVKEYSDWTEYIIQIIRLLSGVMSMIASTAAELLFIGTGIVVSEFIITLILIALLSFFVIKNLKTLGIVLIIVVGFIVVSGGMNLIRLMFFC